MQPPRLHRRDFGRLLVGGIVAARFGGWSLPAGAAGALPPGASLNEYGEIVGYTHPIAFPVIGKVTLTDSFGAPRGSGRRHEGVDILGEKMLPLVAVADGTVTDINIPARSWGYALHVTADDGWDYAYLHVNNDTPGTDDGAAPLEYVYGPGIAKGVRVTRGQVVAYMGDSGNAEGSIPHLHFEMRAPDGTLCDPYPSLLAAERLAGPADPTSVAEATLPPSPIARVAGPDRYGTAVAASLAGWPTGAPDVVVASGDAWAEALPASVLAARVGGPLLLAGDDLPSPVEAEVRRLGARHAWVVGSVGATAVARLGAAGLAVTPVGTSGDAITTACALADRLGAADGVVVLVNGERFADGIAAASLAAGRGWPILLSRATSIPQATVDCWRRLGAREVVLVGGPAVLGDNILRFVPGGRRLGGVDRYETSAIVAAESLRLGGRSPERVFLVTGRTFPDALTAGTMAARAGGLSVLVDGAGSGSDVASRAYLSSIRGAVRQPHILGGPAAVNATADRLLQSALGLA